MTAEVLLDSSPMVTDLGAATEHEIHDMNPIGVEDGEASGTVLRICTLVCRVVTELEDMTGLLMPKDLLR